MSPNLMVQAGSSACGCKLFLQLESLLSMASQVTNFHAHSTVIEKARGHPMAISTEPVGIEVPDRARLQPGWPETLSMCRITAGKRHSPLMGHPRCELPMDGHLSFITWESGAYMCDYFLTAM